jgi:hypothetical protein
MEANGVRDVVATECMDGLTFDLSEALEFIVGYSRGTLISCIPRQRAYFEGDTQHDRLVLYKL